MNFRNPTGWVLPACALGVGLALGYVAATENAGGGKSATPFTPEMRIGGNLYLQTSAEYQAACLQTYRLAAEQLQQSLQANAPGAKKPAVIMDLDETVFDNSSFQTYLYRIGQDYSKERWANYEQNFPQDVTLIPGAKLFIEKATTLGCTVIFLSNRLVDHKDSTIKALDLQKVAGENVADRLFLKDPTLPKSDDKTARRAEVAAKYDVRMFVGDNLRDFDEAFANKGPKEHGTAAECLTEMARRKSEVERTAAEWGRKWFILPNPVYGEWDRLIQVPPVELMHPTSMSTN